MTVFSPGPWEYVRYGTVAFEIQGGGRAIAVVNHATQVRVNLRERMSEARRRDLEPLDSRVEEMEANAALMAAAPDLYRALFGIVQDLQSDPGALHEIIGRNISGEYWERAVAAINKACRTSVHP